jgi:DNA-binding transcriptional regulator GbsR (MarR family)/nucleoside-triphosphatase THEP1
MSVNSQPLIATIYNPHNQSKDALIAGFIARKQKFERLFRDIRDSPMVKPEQHILIQGIRGMGKTTLLLRIAYEVENTPALKQHLIPIVFSEEEYGIGSLADVWERTAQYLGETDASFADLHDTMTQQYGEVDYEQQAFQTLIVALQQQNKKLLLLIDNVGDVLRKLDTQEEQRLREVLLTTPELRLIGATSVVIEQVHDYTKPFYEFFKIIHLDGLTQQEAIELFLKLGETYHLEAVQNLIEWQPGRIEAIRRLTGGVIRTMVLLFEIMVENDSGSVFRDLEVLLDRVTPLYKHRMDDLPAQQQKIVAALATAWDAANTKELAQAVRLESKVVSAQLKQLINSGLVEKVDTHTKNHLYRLEERFFNIWYLMRFGRRTDQRVLWLVRFFETMFAGDAEWMQERIDGHLQAIELGKLDPEAALYLTTAFAGLVKDEEIEDLLKRETRAYLVKVGRNELAREISSSQYESVTTLMDSNKYDEAIFCLTKFNNKSQSVYLDLAACHMLKGSYDEAEQHLINSLLINNEVEKEVEENLNKDGKQIGGGLMYSSLVVNWLVRLKSPEKIEYFASIQENIAQIAINYFEVKNQQRKHVANSLIEHITSSDVILEPTPNVRIVEYIVRLWNNDFTFSPNPNLNPFSLSHTQILILNILAKADFARLGSLYIQLLLAKKQYHTAYNYFANEEWQLKDRFKPLYYATLYFLKDEYPTEFLRMGPELKETVDDVLTEVAQMAIDYA